MPPHVSMMDLPSMPVAMSASVICTGLAEVKFRFSVLPTKIGDRPFGQRHERTQDRHPMGTTPGPFGYCGKG